MEERLTPTGTDSKSMTKWATGRMKSERGVGGQFHLVPRLRPHGVSSTRRNPLRRDVSHRPRLLRNARWIQLGRVSSPFEMFGTQFSSYLDFGRVEIRHTLEPVWRRVLRRLGWF